MRKLFYFPPNRILVGQVVYSLLHRSGYIREQRVLQTESAEKEFLETGNDTLAEF